METHRVVVTGCSGFLGRYVVRELTRRGHEVTGFDLVEPNFKISAFRKGDFTDKDLVLDALTGASIVCHLGGIGDVYLADSNPALAFRANAYGTKVVCDSSLESGVGKLVYASTWEVYGKPEWSPVDEMHPCNPESPYSISKLAGELFVRHLPAEGSTTTSSLRLGTAYGPAMRGTAVIAKFLDAARHGKPLTVYGTGNQFRQFTHAADIASAFALAIESLESDPVYNIAADRTITIAELARLIAARFGVGVTFREARRSDPPSAIVDAKLARRKLGWVPSVSLEAGIDGLVETALG